ncbi:hypothetical protein B4168_3440 [Anoxybacillus flavithermus]|nr:hypothetical protein B4168_3440 [Anoxybacillus flavithermus]OAO84565.1 hypothetical protein GT23_3416 [Parageobacillus thermoglucosidasius]
MKRSKIICGDHAGAGNGISQHLGNKKTQKISIKKAIWVRKPDGFFNFAFHRHSE